MKINKKKLLKIFVVICIFVVVYIITEKIIKTVRFNNNSDIKTEDGIIKNAYDKNVNNSGGKVDKGDENSDNEIDNLKNNEGENSGTSVENESGDIGVRDSEGVTDNEDIGSENTKIDGKSDVGSDGNSYESSKNVEITEDLLDNVDKNSNISENVEKICVHISGEVRKPGVINLPEGSRVIDAIKVAGGETENADFTNINLAYILSDGIKINIPNKNDKNQEFDDIIIDENFSKPQKDEEKNTPSKKSKYKVNINNATQTDLESLPGIGPSTALKILNYRKQNGKFNNIEDIKNVSGIGDAKFEKIKDQIVV